MQDTEYICKTHVRIIFARHGLCEVPRPVAAVSSPHEGSSPTGVSADGGWVLYGGGWEDAGWWSEGGGRGMSLHSTSLLTTRHLMT